MSVNKKSVFFRQSGWLVIATFTGGFFMAMVHPVSSKMGDDYSSFVALLRLVLLVGAPFAAMQTIFARQAAAAADKNHEQQLIATTRALLFSTFSICFLCAIVAVVAAGPISSYLKLSSRTALYFTLLVALTGLWIPIFQGLLQGRHHFGGMGWIQIINGVSRLSLMVVIILVLHGKAAGAMCAVFGSQLIAVAVGGVLTRSVWATRPTVAFDWRGWLGGAIPLSFGFGTILVMQNIDMLFVQGFFEKSQTTLYGAAMLTGFAIVQFIAPVALVMFAHVAKSVAHKEKGDSLGLTLTATIIFGILAGIGCTILPKLPLRLMYFSNPHMWEAAPLVPWYAWSLLPLTVANVLVQNILAQGRYRAIPWLLLAPAGYAVALYLQKPILIQMPPFQAFVRVIQTLGLSSAFLCAMAALFSRRRAPATVSDPDSALGPVISHTANSPAE
ncbi:MAG TPA: lipopolysaccharide biosynthesis protein [Verrucomicrobiae bacterium]